MNTPSPLSPLQGEAGERELISTFMSDAQVLEKDLESSINYAYLMRAAIDWVNDIMNYFVLQFAVQGLHYLFNRSTYVYIV